MHICFLSNGYGEDKAAATIAKTLKSKCSQAVVSGAPMVSNGFEFASRGIPVLTQGHVSPSGGFPLKSVRGFILDLFCTFRYINYISTLRKYTDEVDLPVVVGDVTLMVISYLAFRKRPIFLELAKSTYKGSHFRIEEYLLRKIPCKVFTRDEGTQKDLHAKGIDAEYLGNPMMDGLSPRGTTLAGSPIVGILPGSRCEAYRNLLRILTVIEKMPDEASFYCALPSSLSLSRIRSEAERKGWFIKNDTLTKGNKYVSLLQDAFADVALNADVIIGLAGSANEQAAGLGTPVVSFTGYGPQTTPGRMKSQERLLGGAVKYVEDFPHGVVREVSYLLAHPEERNRRGNVGRVRMGVSGGSEAIAQFVLDWMMAQTPKSELAA